MSTIANTTSSYGVKEQHLVENDIDRAAEEIVRLGYAVVDSDYSKEEVDTVGELFNATHETYIKLYGKEFLESIDEHHGIRLPLAINERFIDLAINQKILALVGKLLRGQFILNQQNGIINPPDSNYNQGIWHRDLPYQHFVSSRPLAVNALYCIDDFTTENGATFVLPASHMREDFPSEEFINSKSLQITAPAGSFIVLNCMLFHRGGQNRSSSVRRAVNHLYSSALIKQQIDIPAALGNQNGLSPEVAELLGFRYKTLNSVADYLRSRQKLMHRTA